MKTNTDIHVTNELDCNASMHAATAGVFEKNSCLDPNSWNCLSCIAIVRDECFSVHMLQATRVKPVGAFAASSAEIAIRCTAGVLLVHARGPIIAR